jgi:hypothetical protein
MRTIVLCLLALLSFSNADAKRAPIIYGSIEKVIKVADLPDDDRYVTNTGQYFDIGFMYSKSHILFMPYSTTTGRFVGFINADNYVGLTDKEIIEIAKAEKISLPKNVDLPFWDRLGGKLALGLLVVGLIAVFLLKVKGTDEEEETFSVPAEKKEKEEAV